MRRRGRQKDGGASLVEFAFVLPLLMLILLGTLTGGLTLSRQNSVKNAVRESTRFAAVQADFGDPQNSLIAMYDQVVAGATGDLKVDVSDRSICVALIDEDGTWDYRLYGATATATTTGTNAALSAVPPTCKDGFDGAVATGTQRVWVRAARTSPVNAVIYSADWKIEAHALTRYEL